MDKILFSTDYFINWFEHAELSVNTKRMYTSHLRAFQTYMKSQGINQQVDFDKFYYVEDLKIYEPIDFEFIDDFVEYLFENGHSNKNVYQYVESIKSFFEFLEATKMIKKNPTRYYPNRSYVYNRKDRSLSKEQCIRLLKAAYEEDCESRRYYILILLLITCGLRSAEVINLRYSQFDFERNIITISSGTKSTIQTVYMTELLKKQFQYYFSHPKWIEWSIKNKRDNKVFFHRNRPLTKGILKRILDRFSKKASLVREITAHDLRHTTAYLMQQSGINLTTIQRQLRHASPSTTLLYLPPSNELIEIAEKNSMRYYQKGN